MAVAGVGAVQFLPPVQFAILKLVPVVSRVGAWVQHSPRIAGAVVEQITLSMPRPPAATAAPQFAAIMPLAAAAAATAAGWAVSNWGLGLLLLLLCIL